MLSPARIFFYINLIFITCVFIGCLNNNAFNKWEVREFAKNNGQIKEFNAFVCEEADVDYKSRRLTVCEIKTRDKILITTGLYPEYNYGQSLNISGLLKKPEEFNGFDYGRYLARYDVYSVMYYPKIKLISSKILLTPSQKIFLRILRFKWKIKTLMDKSIHEPEAGLANALFLGYRRTISKEDAANFSRTGLSHLIAISGSHITILSALILNFAYTLGLKRKKAFKLVILFLIIYPIMTGLSSSAVRSAIMGGIVFIALYNGRFSSIVKPLVFSAAGMLAFNPRLLRDDLGFQLSFAAVLGIIYIYPIFNPVRILIKEKFYSLKKKAILFCWDVFSLTLACQIAVTPIMLINFKQFSIISFIANPLVIWTFPILLSALIAPLFLAGIIPAISPWAFAPAYFLLKYIFIASEYLSKPNWAAIEIRGFGYGNAIVYYLILIVSIIVIKRKNPANKKSAR